MRKVATIAIKDIRLRIRDRSALIVVFFAPLALATITSVAFATWDPTGTSREPLDLVFANEDRGTAGADVAGAFRESPLKELVQLQTVPSGMDVRARVAEGSADSGLIVPTNFASAAAAGRAQLEVVEGPGNTVENAVAAAVAEALLAQVEAVRVSVATALELDPEADPEAIVAAAGRERIPISVGDVTSSRGAASPASYFGPSMAVMALFFTVVFTGKSLWLERRMGLLRRLEATNTTLNQVVIGKAIGASLLAMTGVVVMWATMSVAFSTSWGDPLLVLALLAGMLFSSLGISAFVVGMASSEERLDAIGALLGFLLGLLGGNLIPFNRLPESLVGVSKLTPNAWALQGFVSLSAGASSLSTIALNVIALVVFGVVFGAIGLLRLERVFST